MREVTRERIEGLLAAAVVSGGLVVDPDQREEARGRPRVDLGLKRELITTARVLDQAGVCYRFLKGLASAHNDLPRPLLGGARMTWICWSPIATGTGPFAPSSPTAPASVARYYVTYGVYSGVADASTYTSVASHNYQAFHYYHFF